MAAEIDMSNNRANMAFSGSRTQIWHGLGSEMTEGQSVDEWIVQAGLDWKIEQSPVTYGVGESQKTFPDKQVLYRSDTQEALAVVSDSFKIVQPREVVEFFRELVEKNDMKLSTAGSLFGGKKFWALAELGKDSNITDGDVVKPYLLLTTAADGTLKTTGKLTCTRTVCNNTITIALAEQSKSVVAISHRSEWDPDLVKVNLGLMEESWYNFISNARKMASKKITDKQAETFYQELVFNSEREEPSRVEVRNVQRLMDLYKNGQGSEMTNGTLWGVLNGATELWTHGVVGSKRSVSSQFWDSEIGGGQHDSKVKAYDKALAMV
jgi:phage/plasmid-like protein (TIGR03299 family)